MLSPCFLASLLHHLHKLVEVDAALALVVEVVNHAENLLVGEAAVLLDVLGEVAHVVDRDDAVLVIVEHGKDLGGLLARVAAGDELGCAEAELVEVEVQAVDGALLVLPVGRHGAVGLELAKVLGLGEVEAERGEGVAELVAVEVALLLHVHQVEDLVNVLAVLVGDAGVVLVGGHLRGRRRLALSLVVLAGAGAAD